MDPAQLNEAAEIILAPPNVVTEEQRRAADAVFTNIRATIHLGDAVTALECPDLVPLAQHQLAHAVGECALRDWALLQPHEVENGYKAALNFVVSKPNLSSFVVAECLRSVAMIIKRGILDGRAGDTAGLYDSIQQMLTSNDPQMHVIGVRLTSSLCEQFSSAWRNARFSITWDFHVNAKAVFERSGLRRLLEMSVTTLHALVASNSDILSNPFEKVICEKFLEVAETTFSWNFSARIFKQLFAASQVSTSFRPPKTWNDLLADDQFITLFFQLHAKVRTDEDLALHSLPCLVQLASLSGDCLVDSQFIQHYLENYLTHFLNLFPAGPAPHEVDQFSTIINRLFLYRPVQSIIRLPEPLRSNFILYVARYIEHLTERAMAEAIVNGEHALHAALAPLLESWSIWLRGKWRAAVDEADQQQTEAQLFMQPSISIMSTFMRCVQAPPTGVRQPEATGANDEHADDDENKDDRLLFADILTPFGAIACYTVSTFMQTTTATMRERLTEFSRIAAGEADMQRWPSWQEDMHWLMLVNACALIGEDIDGTCSVQPEVYDHSIELGKARGGPFPVANTEAFIAQCLQQPATSREGSEGSVDPFIAYIGEFLAWAALEHDMLVSVNTEMISPELTRSTLLVLRRILSATMRPSDEENAEDADYPFYPLIPGTNAATTDLVISFAVTKAFFILHKFSGETKLCKEAVGLLLCLVENRARSLAECAALYEQLRGVDIARCVVRSELMKLLVLVGAATGDEQLRISMFGQILEPLAVRFADLVQLRTTQGTPDVLDTDLADLLECYDGVAKAGQSHSASTLYKIVEPVLTVSPNIVRTSTSAVVVTAVLRLMQDVTTKIAIYLTEQSESSALHGALLGVVDAYVQVHGQRFIGMQADDEEKASDLVLLMEILSNVLSNDILDNADERVCAGSLAAIRALEMLLGVMSEALMQVPEVATKFYRLILYLTEFCPESLAVMNELLLNSLCECLTMGLSSQFGTEIVSLCLESLAEVAAYFARNRDKATSTVVGHFHDMLPRVFEACLEHSAEPSIFSEACGSLYALICFDKVRYDSWVAQLLASKSNEAAAARLAEAFQTLLPEAPAIGRREKIGFRQRMEKFLTEIQGLLWLN